MRLRDKVAIVTGAASGMGAATAKLFASEGAKVVVADLLESEGVEVVSEICAAGEVARFQLLNVTSDAAWDSLVLETIAAYGQLDILVNNAGVSWGAPLAEFPEFGWDKVMDTNVKGVFFLTQQCLPLLEAAGTPENPSRVINIGSIDGIQAPAFETYSYGPSKAAVHAMTRQLGAKLAPRNIIVNAIAPGPFPTWMLSTGVGTGGDVEGTDWDAVGKMTPVGRVGSPEDIAGLAIFLSSRAGAFTVGEVITCDGGAVVS